MRSGAPDHFVQPRFPWLIFIGSSLAATLTGCWVAAAHGAPASSWALNIAAWGVGALVAAVISRGGLGLGRWWPTLSLLGLAATFLSPGLSGVHRWIQLGPVRLNGAELFLPAMIVTLAARRRSPLVTLLVPVAAMIVLAWQPDASQAAALAGGSIVAMTVVDGNRPRRIVGALLFVALAVVACLRHDPLAPVPYVEGIIQLAAAASVLAAGLAVVGLAGAALAPLLLARLGSTAEDFTPLKAAAYGLTTYLAVSAAAPAFGAFPVPLVGMGVSPILGVWIGFGCLMALSRRSPGLAVS